jgi:ankyrin repeat protein
MSEQNKTTTPASWLSRNEGFFSQGHSGQNELFQAALSNKPKALLSVLAQGADPLARDKDGLLPIHHAARSNLDASGTLRALAPSSLSATCHFDHQPLAHAADSGSLENLKTLLALGADPCAFSPGRMNSALLNAARGKRPEHAKALVLAGARIDHAEFGGWTALTWACIRQDKAIVGMLVEAGADPYVLDIHGKTLLDIARTNGYQGMEELVAFAERKALEAITAGSFPIGRSASLRI